MGVLDTIVTGGVDSPIAPLILRGFQLMRIMSTSWNKEPTRASRPFSKDRDGFVLAEGSWFFVMEEMEHSRKAETPGGARPQLRSGLRARHRAQAARRARHRQLHRLRQQELRHAPAQGLKLGDNRGEETSPCRLEPS